MLKSRVYEWRRDSSFSARRKEIVGRKEAVKQRAGDINKAGPREFPKVQGRDEPRRVFLRDARLGLFRPMILSGASRP